jgi:hypothetical protein
VEGWNSLSIQRLAAALSAEAAGVKSSAEANATAESGRFMIDSLPSLMATAAEIGPQGHRTCELLL